MLETLNLALAILVFGGAATLVGLWLIVFFRRPGATNALRVAAALALLGAACLELEALPDEANLQALGWLLLVGVVAIDRSLLHPGLKRRESQRRAAEVAGIFGTGLSASALPMASATLLLGITALRSSVRSALALLALALCVAAEGLRLMAGPDPYAFSETAMTWLAASRAAWALGLFFLGAATPGVFRERLRLRTELHLYFLGALLASVAGAASTGLLAREVLLAYPPDRLCFLVLLPLLGAGLLLAPLAARRLLLPLELLSRRTRPLTEGTLENFVHIESGDEVEDVSQSIRVMVGAVQKNRVDLEEQLVRLQELDKLRQQFLANVSHELRTPLTMILGNTDILLEEILGKLNDEQKDFLRTVHEQGQVLHQLIGDVLAFADIKAGRTELNVKEVDVRDLVLSVLTRFTPLLRHKSLKVRGDLPEIKIAADADKLRQVLTHLVSNAVKFSKKGGSLRVSVLPPTDGEHGATRFEVVDNGLGIPKNHLARIFDTFYQVDGSSTREHGGTGIGLTIVKHYVEMHGGRVDIQSEVGKGTAVRFDLPARPLPSARSGALAERAGALPEHVRVLLASPNVNLVRILKTYLVQSGFDVFSVGDPDKIESEVERLQPGLVLLDVDADDEDLWKVLANLRSEEGHLVKLPPVLAVSTRLPRSTAMARGAVDFLELPADYGTFIRVVKTVASSGR
jgi:signal transduction histidine kinase/CheY-like chemotaxis protein